MSSLPAKCIIDTNVPVVANYAKNPANIQEDLIDCVLKCIDAIEHVTTRENSLVIDEGNEIFDEYLRNNLSLKGQPGMGDRFMRWVHDNRWKFSPGNRITITKDDDSYEEFPNHDDLQEFDISDRKFVAVANAHPEKPPILQATDSKWWGWKDALNDVGIAVIFLCPDYVEKKYQEKMVQDGA